MIRFSMFFGVLCGAVGLSAAALAEPQHGIAMHGDPALPKDFKALPYANPDAPQDGGIVYGEGGSFDSLNPYILKGRSPWAMRTHVFESLMARSWDEAFTLYGLLAETVETPEDRSWVEFTLRPEAAFSDGTPVTPEDLIFTMNTLMEKGKPSYRNYFGKVAKVEKVGERGVRYTFNGVDRELPLLIGLAPVLSQKFWEGKDFAESTLEPIVGSGPYIVSEVDPGASLTLVKNPEYWGRDLPVNAGIHNFETVKYIYFKDSNALWEAFKTGSVHQIPENDPQRWAEGYGFPAVTNGDVIKGAITHQRPTGMRGFVFNTRRELFKDPKVREALTLAFDFEWINKTLNYGAYERIQSFYDNSFLGFDGAASGAELALLEPFRDSLPEGALDAGFEQPVSDGSGRDRRMLRQAGALLKEAGWTVSDGVLKNDAGEPFRFEILLASESNQKIANAYAQSLEKLGIEATIRLVDGAQYQQRKTDYDYDMMVNRWWLSLSPGNEQKAYWGIDGVETPGSRNYMGADHPAIEAMIEAMLVATSHEDFTAAVRALDRVLTNQRYVIPFWYAPDQRFAWWEFLDKPEKDALYGYRPEVWWRKAD